jgi:hypothetical protein
MAVVASGTTYFCKPGAFGLLTRGALYYILHVMLIVFGGVAMAGTEPHLSQLMEDLESISREKELLTAEREKAEKKFALATTVAEKQKVGRHAPRSMVC